MPDPDLRRLALRLARTLKSLRSRRRLTQEDIEAYGIPYKRYQQLEAPGKRPANITLKTLLKLARVLKVPPYRLLK